MFYIKGKKWKINPKKKEKGWKYNERRCFGEKYT